MNRASRQAVTPLSPLLLRAQFEQFLPISRQRRQDHDATTRGFGLASFFRGLVLSDGDSAGPNSNTGFYPSLQYSTDKVMLFWQPPSSF